MGTFFRDESNPIPGVLVPVYRIMSSRTRGLRNPGTGAFFAVYWPGFCPNLAKSGFFVARTNRRFASGNQILAKGTRLRDIAAD